MSDHTERSGCWIARRTHVLALPLLVSLLLCVPSADRASSQGAAPVSTSALSQEALSIGLTSYAPSPRAQAQERAIAGTGTHPDSMLLATQAITESVNDIDVALVFDSSGSMNDDTYCYRGYVVGDMTAQAPCYIPGSGEYPEGERLYLPFATWICEPQVPVTYAGYEILVAEAEYFSYTTSYSEHPYDRDVYTVPNTFWMLQRTEHSQASGYRYVADDERGAHLMHMPHQFYIPGHQAVTDDAPRLDYNFDIPDTAPITSTWYVWIRAQCGAYSGSSTCVVHWGVDGTWRAEESTDYDDFGRRGGSEAGSDGNRWVWVRLGSAEFADRGAHQVNIWGGGAGFRLDKVLVTRHPAPPETNTSTYPDRAPAFIRGTTPSWDHATRNAQYQTYVRYSRYGGPADTRGRAGLACHKCNPIYGLAVNQGCTVGQPPGPGCEDLDGNGQIDADEICDNRYDDIFDDAQPIRAAKEAAKDFARQMHARFQQLAFVSYSTLATVDRELNCIQQRGYPPEEYGLGTWSPDTGPDPAWTWCYDHRTDPGGYTGDPVTSTIDGSILYAIERTDLDGWTNIADGLKQGIEVLSAENGHYGRPCAVSVIVLLSDGVPNRWPTYNTCGAGSCCEHDLYQPNSGSPDEDPARDCAIYYADRARENSIIVYSIGLGTAADHGLLQAIADRTAGSYYYAPQVQDLDAILQDIADRSRDLAPCLEMNKEIASSAVQPGKPLTFTLELTNTGDVNLHASITDVLPAHVTPSGVLTWTPTITTPGGVWTQGIVVTVELGYAGPLTNVVEVTTKECFTSTQIVSLVRELRATQRLAPGPVQPGGPLTFTLAVTNTGNVELHAMITDVLPSHVTPTGVLTWTQVTIKPGDVWTQTVTVAVETRYSGPLTNTLQVTTKEGVVDTCTETVTLERWWLYLPLAARTFR